MKSEVVNTDIAPSWFPSETPDERVYWSPNCYVRPHHSKMYLFFPAFSTEAAAAEAQYKLVMTGAYAIGDVIPVDREWLSFMASSQGFNKVGVLDEHGNIVEEWTV